MIGRHKAPAEPTKPRMPTQPNLSFYRYPVSLHDGNSDSCQTVYIRNGLAHTTTPLIDMI